MGEAVKISASISALGLARKPRDFFFFIQNTLSFSCSFSICAASGAHRLQRRRFIASALGNGTARSRLGRMKRKSGRPRVTVGLSALNASASSGSIAFRNVKASNENESVFALLNKNRRVVQTVKTKMGFLFERAANNETPKGAARLTGFTE